MLLPGFTEASCDTYELHIVYIGTALSYVINVELRETMYIVSYVRQKTEGKEKKLPQIINLKPAHFVH